MAVKRTPKRKFRMDRKMGQAVRAFLRALLADRPTAERKAIAKEVRAMLAAMLKRRT